MIFLSPIIIIIIIIIILYSNTYILINMLHDAYSHLQETRPIFLLSRTK